MSAAFDAALRPPAHAIRRLPPGLRRFEAAFWLLVGAGLALGSVVSGVLCALALPEPGLRVLAWVGLVPLLPGEPESFTLRAGEAPLREIFVPAALEVLPSFGGTMADELLLWTRRSGNLKPRGHVLDAGSMVNLGTPVLADKHLPRAFAVLPDVGRSAAMDTVVITAAARDRLQRAFLIDGRGSRIRTLVLP